MAQTARDYEVRCHRCGPGQDKLMRSQAILHGTAKYGALWHCPEHHGCTKCPHGDWCDDRCSEKHERED